MSLPLTGTLSDKTYSYDPNGNLIQTVSGTTKVAYVWDAANRLVATERFTGTTRTGRSEFTYDGMGRRTRIVEKDGAGAITSDRRYVWCGTDICEERDSSGTVTKRYFAQGMKIISGTTAGNYYYTRDHLGSVRELTDASKNVRARYDYDPYGKRGANQITTGTPIEADFGFTGHFLHPQSGLYLALYRAYDSESGRWLSRDPIGERGGLNLYGYVGNNPINRIDPLGLWGIQFGENGRNRGWGDPTFVFDNDSWMDLANGAAATMDGLIPVYDPFSDLYSNGDIWSDDNEGLSDWERDLYNKSHTGGQIAQVCLLSATPFRPFTRARQPITHFGGPLQPGQWVMTGGPTARNWLMAGAKPSWLLPANQTVATALPGSLRWPSGWQWIKGFLGQRIYAP